MSKRSPLATRIHALLAGTSSRPLKPKEIARALEIPPSDYRDLKNTLREMVAAGDLYRVKRGRFAPPEKINVVIGRFAKAHRGGATVTGDPPGNEVLFIRPDRASTAQHGDRVAARVMERRSGPLPEGEVIRVLERAHAEIVGTVQMMGSIALVRPENPNVTRDVLIPPESLRGAEHGQLVSVRVTSWGDERTTMVGEVLEVLGKRGDPGLDVLIVMKEYRLPLRFPEAVEAFAHSLPKKITDGDLRDRADLRTLDCVTIDPVDAKDFDDALSYREEQDGRIEIGVHIADVGHYVKVGTPLDDEARQRATSVYLVDRVVPMLPEALSNRLCSLVPGEDRLAFSVLFHLDRERSVASIRFTPSIIRSRRRFTYQEVQALLDGAEPAPADRPLLRSLRELATLSERLIAERHRRGSLDFDLPESRVILNEHGLPIDIQKVVRLEAHRLVESFMLLANEAVAKRLRTIDLPTLFRVHMGPDPLAATELREALARFGLRLPVGPGRPITAKMLQKVLLASEGEPQAELIHMLILRSMKRALYHVEPLGHFGLATKNYTHFTSPIRRYPDLVVHRVLRAVLRRGPAPPEDGAAMFHLAEHCSNRERVAEEAERASVELKKVQFMAERVGEEFDGRIVSVTSFGFFVELTPFHVSGLVHVNRLADDYYHFDEDQLLLLGEHTGRTFRIGQPVRVVVTRADIARRQIDFELVGEEPEKKSGKRRRAPATK